MADPPYSVLIVDDDPGVRQSIRLCLEGETSRIMAVGTLPGALETIDRSGFDVIFLDLWLGSDSGIKAIPEILRRQPGAHIIMITAFASYESAVEAIKLGAVDYLPKPFTPDQVRQAAGRVIAATQLKRRVAELEERIKESDPEGFFETQSPRYRAFLASAEKVAASDAVVLLAGESGTGKNVLARWIRARSKRRDRPFVTVLCPMLSGDLLTSALFGHRKGAFTGAVADAVGKVEEAEGGTLFLDEVGELSPDAQARLLRFLNDQTYERLGEARERKGDVRLIAATNRPLDRAVSAREFREDLYFRLNVVSLVVPPLRERKEDIPLLANHYLRFFAARQGREDLSFSPEALQALLAYPWPGNLRELRNMIERALILADSSVLDPRDLGLPGGPSGTPPPSPGGPTLGSDVTLEAIEREHIAQVVAHAPTLEAAARVLGIDASTLQRKRKRYGLA